MYDELVIVLLGSCYYYRLLDLDQNVSNAYIQQARPPNSYTRSKCLQCIHTRSSTATAVLVVYRTEGRSKKYTFDDDFGGSYTFDDSESQPTSTLLMIPPYPVGCRDVPAARKHKGSVGTSWMYEIDVLRAKDESADLLSCCWLIPEKSA